MEDKNQRYRRMAGNYEMQRNIESINYKMAVILAIIIIGIFSNGARTYADMRDDAKVKRIRQLRVENDRLREQLESCQTGTPMPRIKDK